MTGHCIECGKVLKSDGRCPVDHPQDDSMDIVPPPLHPALSAIGALPKASTSRRLLGSGVEYTAYVICVGIITIFDLLSAGLVGLLSLLLLGLVVLRDFNAGAFNIAKRISRMRVVDKRTGRPASNLQALLRNGYYLALLLLSAFIPWIDVITFPLFLTFVFLDLMMILASPQGRRLGDLIAATQVVEAEG